MSWIDRHPLLFVYLVGCFLVLFLSLFKVVLFWTVDWLIRGNVLQRNLKKLLPPEEKTITEKATWAAASLFLEMLLSWINVAVIVWQIFAALFRVARDQLQPAPEAIKQLRFPLRNNPDMPRESVWAYVQALGIRAGNLPPDADDLVQSLEQLARCYSDLDKAAALNHLGSLGVLDGGIINSSLTRLSKSSCDEI